MKLIAYFRVSSQIVKFNKLIRQIVVSYIENSRIKVTMDEHL
jgi:hypothetical protein